MMRTTPLLFMAIIATLTLACASRWPLNCPSSITLKQQTELRTIRHPNGAVFASGRGLPAEWDDEYEVLGSFYKRDVPATRVGDWEYFYADGSARAHVTYALACYVQCCTAGLCPQVHDYPVGPFVLWYPSGRKLGEGSFAARTYHVDTSCQGGDDTTIGRMSRDSRFWREDGSEMTVDEARAAGHLLAGW